MMSEVKIKREYLGECELQCYTNKIKYTLPKEDDLI